MRNTLGWNKLKLSFRLDSVLSTRFVCWYSYYSYLILRAYIIILECHQLTIIWLFCVFLVTNYTMFCSQCPPTSWIWKCWSTNKLWHIIKIDPSVTKSPASMMDFSNGSALVTALPCNIERTILKIKKKTHTVCAQYKMTQLKKVSCLCKLITNCTEINGNQWLPVGEEELQHNWMLRKTFARNVKYLTGFLEKVNLKSFSVDYHYAFFRGFWKQIILNKCGKNDLNDTWFKWFICALLSVGFGFRNIPKAYCAVLYIQYTRVYTNIQLHLHNEYTIDSVVVPTNSTLLFFTLCHALSYWSAVLFPRETACKVNVV